MGSHPVLSHPLLAVPDGLVDSPRREGGRRIGTHPAAPISVLTGDAYRSIDRRLYLEQCPSAVWGHGMATAPLGRPETSYNK